jgi:iron(III) transport system ATP-binding protein
MAVISLSGITKSFGATAVLKSVDIEIADGCFFTLLGPSGCGKTTLLRAIAGFVAPDAGSVRFDNEDVTHRPVHKRDIGMVFQDYALFPDKTVFDNVAYGLRARGIDETTIRTRVHDHLQRVELVALGARYAAELSGGQRQRVALARALVIKPRVLLMDEPLSNLDAKLRVTMRETIRELQRAAAITTIFVTHDQDEALSMSDRVAVMERGRVAQVGSPTDLYDTPASAYVADFIGAANILPVEIAGREGEHHLRVMLNGHPLRCLDATGGGAGVQAALIARPEQLRLSPRAANTGRADADMPNILPGRIAKRRYLGSRTSLMVDIGRGCLVLVEQPAEPDAPALAEGEAVDIAIPMTCRALSMAAVGAPA